MKTDFCSYTNTSRRSITNLLKLSIACFIAVLLAGCGNPYSTFYCSSIGSQTVDEVPGLIPHSGQPQCLRGSDPETDSQTMKKNGYDMVGYSSFNSGFVGTSGAVRQAKKVKAAKVIVYCRYSHTVSGVVPITTKNPDTTITTYNQGNLYGSTYSTHRGNIYGAGRPIWYAGQSTGSYSGSYSGYSTTTIPGAYSTQYVPYRKDRYDFYATYWALRGSKSYDRSPGTDSKVGPKVILGQRAKKKGLRRSFVGVKLKGED